jgi:hypothetical protein
MMSERDRLLRYMHMHFVRGLWRWFTGAEPWMAKAHLEAAVLYLDGAREEEARAWRLKYLPWLRLMTALTLVVLIGCGGTAFSIVDVPSLEDGGVLDQSAPEDAQRDISEGGSPDASDARLEGDREASMADAPPDAPPDTFQVDGTTGACPPYPAFCCDGIKDGDETDVDCGGLNCKACHAGQACLMGFDCTSGSCVGQICQ